MTDSKPTPEEYLAAQQDIGCIRTLAETFLGDGRGEDLEGFVKRLHLMRPQFSAAAIGEELGRMALEGGVNVVNGIIWLPGAGETAGDD